METISFYADRLRDLLPLPAPILPIIGEYICTQFDLDPFSVELPAKSQLFYLRMFMNQTFTFTGSWSKHLRPWLHELHQHLPNLKSLDLLTRDQICINTPTLSNYMQSETLPKFTSLQFMSHWKPDLYENIRPLVATLKHTHVTLEIYPTRETVITLIQVLKHAEYEPSNFSLIINCNYVIVPPEIQIKGLQLLLENFKVRNLTVIDYSHPSSPEKFSILAQFMNLRRYHLDIEHPVTQDDFSELANIPELSLKFRFNASVTPLNLPNVVSLELADTTQFLSQLSFPNLEKLVLNNFYRAPDEDFVQLSKFPKLTTLIVDSNYKMTDSALEHLKCLTHLHTFEAPNCDVSPQAIYDLLQELKRRREEENDGGPPSRALANNNDGGPPSEASGNG